jgi:hypothetical protein
MGNPIEKWKINKRIKLFIVYWNKWMCLGMALANNGLDT